MDRFGAVDLRIFATLVTFLMANTILGVSGHCVDPGTPVNGNRRITSEGNGFAAGTVVYFSCNAHYTLVGAKKIICKVNGKWNAKPPVCSCKSPLQGCPLPPPIFAHANITTNPVVNSKGSYVYYACVRGYVPDPVGHLTRLLCDKDSATQCYSWSGNFTCKKKTCGNPPYPSTGNGNYSLSVQGPIRIATYYCDATYALKIVSRYRTYIEWSYLRSCGQSGYWSGTTPTCVKTCNSIDIAPDHGHVSSWTPHYYFFGPPIYTQGVTVSFSCDIRYQLQGSASKRCLESGYWSVSEPRCELSSCTRLTEENIINGQATFNGSSNESGYPIWTTVTFTCNSGYQLIGLKSRQCQRDGHWTGQHNPKCIKSKITCRPPDHVSHGQYELQNSTYLLNARVHLVCIPGYFLWGDAWQHCSSENGGSWIHQPPCSLGDSCDPECLPPHVYAERCEKKSGHHATFRGQTALCSPSSGHCVDPGTPVNGNRIIASEGNGFAAGTVIYFSCNAHYTLVGAKKIICSVKGDWNGKPPICKTCKSPLQGCPLPPPIFAHANITTNPVVNSKGSYVYYACVRGYVPDPVGHLTRLLCDKDSATQCYSWSGNFTCKKKTCGNPPYPSTGNGNYSLSVQGSTRIATYYCDATYALKIVSRYCTYIKWNYSRSCGQSGYWSGTTPTCVKTCNSIDIAPDHGHVSSRTPHYCFVDPPIYTQGVTVSFSCDIRYQLQGSASKRCLESGYWSVDEPRCELSSCTRLTEENIINGQATFNDSSDESGYPIWTTVTFTCNSGYQLIGLKSRQCQRDGHWTGQHNPKCIKSKITCRPPDHVSHGQYMPQKPTYLLNARVHFVCMPPYFLWGDAWQQCSIENGGSWIHVPPCSSVDSCDPECLPLPVYSERCEKKSGHHATFRGQTALCLPSSATDETPTADLISIKSRDNELDKMTIVVATAGSTLGALVVLLTALVCFRRFHRSRRFRHSAFRSRRYSDDDRIAIIAAYTGDVHFILPSYDEAINQVESLPPSFESVVDGDQGRENETAANNNSETADDGANNTAAGTTENGSDPAASTSEVAPSTTEDQPMNIVSNPLADSSHGVSEIVHSSDHVLSAVNQGGVYLSEESLNAGDFDSSPKHPSESLPSSSSEDDLTSSQTQPLLGNGTRGVMV